MYATSFILIQFYFLGLGAPSPLLFVPKKITPLPHSNQVLTKLKAKTYFSIFNVVELPYYSSQPGTRMAKGTQLHIKT